MIYINLKRYIDHLFCIGFELDKGNDFISTKLIDKFINFWSINYQFQSGLINPQELARLAWQLKEPGIKCVHWMCVSYCRVDGFLFLKSWTALFCAVICNYVWFSVHNYWKIIRNVTPAVQFSFLSAKFRIIVWLID